MNRYTTEEYYRSPTLDLALEAAARAERAKAIRAGYAWLVKQVKTRLAPRFRPSRWMARLG